MSFVIVRLSLKYFSCVTTQLRDLLLTEPEVEVNQVRVVKQLLTWSQQNNVEPEAQGELGGGLIGTVFSSPVQLLIKETELNMKLTRLNVFRQHRNKDV